MKIKLNASIMRTDDKIIFLGKKNYQMTDIIGPEADNFLTKFETGLDETELQSWLKDDSCYALYKKMSELNLLVLSENKYGGTVLEKTYDFLNFHLGTLHSPFSFENDIHIALIGCGGTGSNIGLCLASSGIKKFTLIDYDRIQISNLNRQFAYDSADIGKSKAQCLKYKLLRINSDVNISLYERKITCSEDLHCLSNDVSLLVSAIDTPAVKSSLYIVEYAMRHKVPVIFGAAGYDTITAGPLLTTETAKATFHRLLQRSSYAVTKPITGSIASTNLLLSAILANNITSFFYPFSKPDLINVRKIYNPVSMITMREIYYDNN
ncbi:ThiF family adenylyltransferase [Salmonella enterica]|nr:ThiF family adenylyltransferase [Salmonella enterica]